MAIVEVLGFSRNTTTKSSGELTVLAYLQGSATSPVTANTIAPGAINEDFAGPLQQLLPNGALWNRVAGSVLNNLMRALSYSFTWVVRRGATLVEEANPQTTNELVGDWERLLDLPGCADPPTNLAERRAQIIAKMRGYLDPTDANLTSIALEVGYTIVIRTFQPFVAGSAAGDSLTQTTQDPVSGSKWRFVWEVTTPHGSNDALLECVMAAQSPGHTLLTFYYWYDLWRERTADGGYTGGFLAVDYDIVKETWCAVGTLGAIQASDDGYTWAARTAGGGFGGTFYAVAHDGSGLWCAVGSSGAIQTSSATVLWFVRTPGGGFGGTFYAVTHDGSGLWCAVGSSGEIQTSPDGLAWTHRTPAGAYSGSFRCVTHNGASTWLIAGTAGEIQISAIATSLWQKKTAGGGYTGTFESAAYGNGTWVLVGTGGEIQTSVDTSTWTHRDNASGFVGTFRSVVFADSVFYAVGDTSEIQASSDGINWYQIDSAFVSNYGGIGHDSDKLLCAVANNGKIATATRLEPDDA